MSQLTYRDLNLLGDSFSGMAQAVGKYRYTNLLDANANTAMRQLQDRLLDLADRFYTTSAVLIMERVNESLYAIERVGREMERDYNKLRSVQKAIDVAAACVSVGSAVFSKNPLLITSAVGDLIKIWTAKIEH